MATIFGPKAAVLLSILIFVFSFPFVVLSVPSFTRIELPPQVVGPLSIAFDLSGAFYTGLADGRILKYQGPKLGFQEFAFTAATRSKELCDGTNDPNLGPICGRPVGLGISYRTKQVFIADAFFGLVVVGPNGRLATQLVTGAEGVPFKFPNGLDVDQVTGIVYFTDSSAVYDPRYTEKSIQTNDSTGRFLKYDPKTGEVTVLMRNLSGPAGAAVSRHGTFVLVSQFIGNRTIKFWLTGPRAYTADIINSQPRPNNIKRTLIGDFWEAAALRKQPTEITVPIGQRINGFGVVSHIVNFEAQYNTSSISEVQEHAGALYISSRSATFIGIYRPR